MRTKQGLLALLTCSAVAMGGLATETALAKPAPAKAAKKAAKKSKKKSKRCKILLVNGNHRCKGERARKTVSSNSSSAPAAPVVNNVTINNIDNPPVPAPAPAASATATAPSTNTNSGQGPKDQNGDGKPGNGPKPKKDKKDKPSHGSH